jgi:hypothetical protein
MSHRIVGEETTPYSIQTICSYHTGEHRHQKPPRELEHRHDMRLQHRRSVIERFPENVHKIIEDLYFSGGATTSASSATPILSDVQIIITTRALLSLRRFPAPGTTK